MGTLRRGKQFEFHIQFDVQYSRETTQSDWLPVGSLAPNLWNFSGFLRKSTISSTSDLASSTPCTSSKVYSFSVGSGLKSLVICWAMRGGWGAMGSLNTHRWYCNTWKSTTSKIYPNIHVAYSYLHPDLTEETKEEEKSETIIPIPMRNLARYQSCRRNSPFLGSGITCIGFSRLPTLDWELIDWLAWLPIREENMDIGAFLSFPDLWI